MNTICTTLLAGLTLLAPSRLFAQETAFSATTFGGASGDVPMRGLGLVLELVQYGTSQPTLRLSGGVPGHIATIFLDDERLTTPVNGLRGTQFYTQPGATAIHGIFDLDGNFEVPLPDAASMPQGTVFFAQGLHTGLWQFADGKLMQASQAIEIRRRADLVEVPLAFDDLLPHLPDQRELGSFTDVASLLQDGLDSAGDSMGVKVEIEASLGLGIEIVDAKAGMKLAAQFQVERTENDLYEVTVGNEIAVLAGVSGGTGAEVGLELAQSYAMQERYVFHSAPGAARGIIGMVVAQAFPAASGASGAAGQVLDPHFMNGAAQGVAELQAGIDALRTHADELEQILWTVLDAKVVAAEKFRAQALAKSASLKHAYDTAPWASRPVRWIAYCAQLPVVALANANLKISQAARIQGENAVNAIRATIQAKQDAISNMFEGLARAGRIASSIVQLRPFVEEHRDGVEFSFERSLEAEAKIGLPVVDIGGMESGYTEAMKRGMSVRIELANQMRPLTLTVTGKMERERELDLAGPVFIGSIGAHTDRTIGLAQTFTKDGADWNSAGATLSFELETEASSAMGILVQYEQAVGRSFGLSMTDEQFLSSAGYDALASREALMERVGAFEVGFEMQDCRTARLKLSASVDVSGNGGGIEIEAEWSDKGRMLSRSITVADGVQRVLDGACQVIDAQTETVANVN